MTDLIREVVTIQGKFIEFFGIIYLERGLNPKALLMARFPSQQGLLGYRSNSNLGDLTELVHGIGNQLALLYDCEMAVTSITDRIDSRNYACLLVHMQSEWERQKNARSAILCLN